MKLPIHNLEGKKTGEIEPSPEWEKLPLKHQAIKDTVVWHLANVRRGTAKTKTRGELSFSTRKPWKQKGTGRARAGTTSSPLWRHGGVTFGPKPRDYSFKLPKKVRRLALKSVIGDKLRNSDIIVIDKIEIEKPKTKTMALWLKNLNGGIKPLLVTEKTDRPILLSIRNIPGAGYKRACDLDAYTLLKHRKIIVTKPAWSEIEKNLLKHERPIQDNITPVTN